MWRYPPYEVFKLVGSQPNVFYANREVIDETWNNLELPRAVCVALGPRRVAIREEEIEVFEGEGEPLVYLGRFGLAPQESNAVAHQSNGQCSVCHSRHLQSRNAESVLWKEIHGHQVGCSCSKYSR